MNLDEYDVMVIGCGAAGLRAAIAAADRGRSVCVLSKAGQGLGTCTVMSRGHFAGSRTGWTLEQHRESTLKAGKGLNQEELVEALVRDAPKRLEEILRWGLQGVAEKGQLYAQGPPPVWGREIIRCLIEKAAEAGVKFQRGLTVAGIRAADGIVGVSAYWAEKGEWTGFASRAAVLATGGAGALFQRHDNPQRMVGEGYALALEAGASLRDMEFFQFLPLATAEPGRPQFPIPSTIAGRGRLVNSRGEEILEKYAIHERPADVHARDRLSQALMSELRKGNRVFLDLMEVSDREWEADALGTGKILIDRFRAKQAPLRVAPTAHFCMGGVCIDAFGRTAVPGLFAAGEVAGGLHGANRLAGNALSEALVFGARAGEAAALWVDRSPQAGRKNLIGEMLSPPASEEIKQGAGGSSRELKWRLRQILWERAES